MLRPFSVRIGSRRLDLACLCLVGLLACRGVAESLFSDFHRRSETGLTREGLRHYEYFKRHLQSPFEDYSARQVLFDGFKIVALSHMVCGLVNVAVLDPARQKEILPLIAEAIARAQSPQVAPLADMAHRPKTWTTQGLYLSHLNLMLGCYRLVGGDGRYDVFNRRLTDYLATTSLNNKDSHVSSYGFTEKFPADQSVTLLSLYIYDRFHGTHLSDEPIRRWLAYMKTDCTDDVLGLPCSSLDKAWIQRRPRGCAMSWTCLYMAQFDFQEAKNLYQTYRARYFKSYWGVGGFREWPPNESHGMNSDTGPIIFGLGFAASGLGIGPTRLFDDHQAYAAIMRSAALVGWPQEWRRMRWYLFSPLLGESILFHGETATRWFPETS